MLPCARMNVALASDYQQISRHTQEDHSERGSSCPPPPDSSQARGTSSGDVAGLGAAPRLLLSGAGLEQDGDTPCGQQLLGACRCPHAFHHDCIAANKNRPRTDNFSGVSKEANTRPPCRREHATQWLFLKQQLLSTDGA